MAGAVARVDSDSDGLIDISSLAQLNAMRWDLDSDGLADDAANNVSYTAAFPVADSGNVCNAGGEGEGACVGYELMANLDFDTGNAGDRTDDDYYNDDTNDDRDNGAGWLPIGSLSSAFTGVFDGRGYAIANLYISRDAAEYVGLFGYIGRGGEVRNLGLAGVDITDRYYFTNQDLRKYVGGLAGYNNGTISASYTTGTVSGT